MNGLPAGVDLSPLYGRALEQARFGGHQLQLVFGEACIVAVEGRCALQRGESPPEMIEDYAGSATAICGLLGWSVNAAVRTVTGGLRIEFGGEVALELFVDRADFESFQLHFGETTYVA
jgi:hypothetical protein